jgi:hypothetical protein
MMKKAPRFLNILLAALALFQGSSLVASCSVPCGMTGAAKLHCVVASILEHERTLACEKKGAVRSASSLCGSLDWRSQSLLSVQAIRLSPITFCSLVQIAPSGLFLDDHRSESIYFTRAGPPQSSGTQALLAVPPQNAPPVLI